MRRLSPQWLLRHSIFTFCVRPSHCPLHAVDQILVSLLHVAALVFIIGSKTTMAVNHDNETAIYHFFCPVITELSLVGMFIEYKLITIYRNVISTHVHIMACRNDLKDKTDFRLPFLCPVNGIVLQDVMDILVWSDDYDYYTVDAKQPSSGNAFRADLIKLLNQQSCHSIGLVGRTSKYRVYGFMSKSFPVDSTILGMFSFILPSLRSLLSKAPSALPDTFRHWCLEFETSDMFTELTADDIHLIQIFTMYQGNLLLTLEKDAKTTSSSTTLFCASSMAVLKAFYTRLETLQILLRPKRFHMKIYCTQCQVYRSLQIYTPTETTKLVTCEHCHLLLV